MKTKLIAAGQHEGVDYIVFRDEGKIHHVVVEVCEIGTDYSVIEEQTAIELSLHHKSMNLGHPWVRGKNAEEACEYLVKKGGKKIPPIKIYNNPGKYGAFIIPIYSYSHGSIVLSAGSSPRPLDSRQAGAAIGYYADVVKEWGDPNEDETREDHVLRRLKGIIHTYNMELAGLYWDVRQHSIDESYVKDIKDIDTWVCRGGIEALLGEDNVVEVDTVGGFLEEYPEDVLSYYDGIPQSIREELVDAKFFTLTTAANLKEPTI